MSLQARNPGPAARAGGETAHRPVSGPGGRHRRASGLARPRWRLAVTILALTAAVVAGSAAAVASLTATGPGPGPGTTGPGPGTTGPGPGPGDPLSGIRLFVDPDSPAAATAAATRRSDPAAAAMFGRIASQPTGIWLGPWNPPAEAAAIVRTVLARAGANGSMPLLVLYAFPYRGCAPGTAAAAGTYEQWVGQVAAAIGAGRAAVVLEPDALAQDVTLSCLSVAERASRVALIRQAVDRLARLPHVALYLDAGNSHWQAAPAMAALLTAAGIRSARGFAVNVSNFYSTAAEESYGDRIGTLLHGVHYVIDTSRNGRATANTWCNPTGQALGAVPTVRTGRPLADALLWIKPPGVSDGPCDGGPRAGAFWPAYALSLAVNAHW